MDRTIPILIAILLVRVAAGEAQYQRAKRLGDTVFFPLGVGLRLLLGIGTPFLLYVAYQLFLEARQNGEWWLPIASLVFATGSFLVRPPDIRINLDGIHEIGLFGLRRKTVAWEGAAARFVPGLKEVVVVGRDGTTVKHTAYHAGQQEFLIHLQQHKVFLQA